MSNQIVFWTSYSDNNINVFNKSLPNHERYCNLHNYDLINFKEPYNKYIDVQRIVDLLKKYELVISFGTDVIIKRMFDPIENYINSFERNYYVQRIQSKTNTQSEILLYIQNVMKYIKYYILLIDTKNILMIGQYILNELSYKKLANIYESPYLQIAAPIMNPNIDYSSVNLNKFLSFHYHNMRWLSFTKNEI